MELFRLQLLALNETQKWEIFIFILLIKQRQKTKAAPQLNLKITKYAKQNSNEQYITYRTHQFKWCCQATTTVATKPETQQIRRPMTCASDDSTKKPRTLENTTANENYFVNNKYMHQYTTHMCTEYTTNTDLHFHTSFVRTVVGNWHDIASQFSFSQIFHLYTQYIYWTMIGALFLFVFSLLLMLIIYLI